MEIKCFIIVKYNHGEYLDVVVSILSQDQWESLRGVKSHQVESRVVKRSFRKRKWIYLNKKRKLFHQNTSFQKGSPFGLTISKGFLETGNGII